MNPYHRAIRAALLPMLGVLTLHQSDMDALYAAIKEG